MAMQVFCKRMYRASKSRVLQADVPHSRWQCRCSANGCTVPLKAGFCKRVYRTVNHMAMQVFCKRMYRAIRSRRSASGCTAQLNHMAKQVFCKRMYRDIRSRRSASGCTAQLNHMAKQVFCKRMHRATASRCTALLKAGVLQAVVPHC